jgi:hypothetical protein
MVQFGIRGAMAPALGVGNVSLRGCSGIETVHGVLHVPELAASLFSVSAAVREGMAVHFRPDPNGIVVVLQSHGRTVFTASEHNGLFFLDSQIVAVAAAAACGSQLAVQ